MLILLLNALKGSASFNPRRLVPHLFNWKPSNPNRHSCSKRYLQGSGKSNLPFWTACISLTWQQHVKHFGVNAQMPLHHGSWLNSTQVLTMPNTDGNNYFTKKCCWKTHTTVLLHFEVKGILWVWNWYGTT